MEAIIEKIKKLLALSERNNSPHEAATAAARAQALMMEHKLEVSDLKDVPVEEVEQAVFLEEGKNLVNWRANLMWGLARNNFCEMITSKAPRNGEWVRCYKIIGRKSDSDAVQYLFCYFVSEINRLAAEAAVKETEYMAKEEKRLWTPGKSWFMSFRLGAAQEIADRLDAKRAETENTFKASAEKGLAKASTALVVLNKSKEEIETYKKKHFPKLRTHAAARVSRMDAYESGREAGRGVQLPGDSKSLGAEPKRIGGAK